MDKEDITGKEGLLKSTKDLTCYMEKEDGENWVCRLVLLQGGIQSPWFVGSPVPHGRAEPNPAASSESLTTRPSGTHKDNILSCS